jgi:mono/diheme cytochrome c family protein
MNVKNAWTRERTTAAACAALLASVLLGVSACGTARRSEPIAGPLTSASTEVVRGRVAYMRYCNQCHVRGEGSFGPALNNKPAPRFLIKLQVRQGLGAMPRFSDSEISSQELDDLVDYMIAMRRHGRS